MWKSWSSDSQTAVCISEPKPPWRSKLPTRSWTEYSVAIYVPQQRPGGAWGGYLSSGHWEGVSEAWAILGEDGDLCFCGACTTVWAQREVSGELLTPAKGLPVADAVYQSWLWLEAWCCPGQLKFRVQGPDNHGWPCWHKQIHQAVWVLLITVGMRQIIILNVRHCMNQAHSRLQSLLNSWPSPRIGFASGIARIFSKATKSFPATAWATGAWMGGLISSNETSCHWQFVCVWFFLFGFFFN